MGIKTEQTGTEGIEFLYNPGSIAIIGASADINKPSGRPLAALLRRGYRGKIYPVNPRYNLVTEYGEYIKELDINPLFAYPGGVIAVYAAVIKK